MQMIILDYGKLDQIIGGLEKMARHEHLHHKSEGSVTLWAIHHRQSSSMNIKLGIAKCLWPCNTFHV